MSTPAQQVRESLEDSRAAGLDFDVAWTRAVRSLPSGSDRAWDASHWSAALRETRAAWERAYVGAPTLPVDRAAAALVGALVA